MELFKMAKNAMSIRNKLGEVDKKLRAEIIDVEYKNVKIQVNAKNEFLNLNLPDSLLKENKSKIEKVILSAFIEACKRAQTIMAKEAKNLTNIMKISER
ncbi:MAG: YbaB/EbfC family nucleoid-associated protein [Endomicrobium sp.]|jgi:DNA-binding protein YbaB|nr:YbaB/EbfC family nucleoid-associated protein [Endomicrobium sp.]